MKTAEEWVASEDFQVVTTCILPTMKAKLVRQIQLDVLTGFLMALVSTELDTKEAILQVRKELGL